MTRAIIPALLMALLLSSAARFEGKLQPCHIEDLDEQVLCGTWSVWENREARTGRKIDLNVVVLPARSPDPIPDPLFFLAGGPGQAASGAAPLFARMFAELRRDRDIVFVDQRGVGKSGVLECKLPGSDDDPQGWLREMFPLDSVRTCAEELSRKADLRQYTNVQAMDDFDDVRAWLGYERINIFGGSYGTRSAMVYLKRHPGRVRSLVLSRMVPIDYRAPLTYARSAQTSLDRILDDCAAEEACRAAFPNVRAELAEVLERLDRAPGKATVEHKGKKFELSIPRTTFAATLRSIQYEPGLYIRIPMLIHEAWKGNYAPMIREAILDSGPGDWMGVFLSVTCAEDVARIRPEDIKASGTEGTYLGDDRLRQQRAACSVWPTAELPADFWEPAVSSVPVLALSGWLDPVTPPEVAEEVLRGFPNHLHVVIRDGSHVRAGLNDMQCEFDLITRFVTAGSPHGLDTSCVERMRRQPFVLKAD